ncbi:MAG: hypothetical protein WCY49_04460 [Anaerovoracaceae bacterium]|nr:hypothetical protein [Clostridiales bacterium]
MASTKKIREGLEVFYGTIIENYKMAQRAVMSQSRVVTMFKKADYDGRIKDFSRVILALRKLNLETDDTNTEIEQDIVEAFKIAKARLTDLCEDQIKLQETLKMKATREKKVPVKEYTRVMENVRKSHDIMQRALHRMDIIYTDFLEEIEEL